MSHIFFKHKTHPIIDIDTLQTSSELAWQTNMKPDLIASCAKTIDGRTLGDFVPRQSAESSAVKHVSICQQKHG